MSTCCARPRSPSSDRARRRPTRSKWPAGWVADLARRNVTVVSGMARGVDSAAHRGALEGGRHHGRRVRLRRRCHLSARASRAREADRRARGARERVSPRQAAIEEQLSAAEPHHQRAVACRRDRRGGRRQRLADYRRLCARAGARSSGGARQRARRAKLRRARAPARRCKACRVCGRYLGGAPCLPDAGRAEG